MKRITKILIILSVLCVLCKTAVYADDIDGYKYEQDARLIIGMGIMTGYDDGTFRPDNQITRAEFVTLLMRTLGWDGESSFGSEKIFSDMDGHWANPYVNQANAIKVANGNGDGTFDPNAQVSHRQAITFLANAMGYDEIAQKRGGYPDGYIAVGTEIGLSKGITAAYDAPLTRGEVTKILSNALDAETVEMAYTKNGVSYEKGDTLLKCIGYTVYKGTVTSAWGASLDGEKVSNKYRIFLNGQRYQTSFADGIKYLGMKVDAYVYDAEGDEEEIRYLKVNNRSQEISLDAEDIDEVNLGTNIKYTVDDKQRTIRINSSFIVLKNGDMMTSSQINKAMFDLEDGRVDFKDVDGDNTYDLAMIWSREEYVVSRTVNGKIYCEYNKLLDFSDIGDDIELSVIYDGKIVSFDSIKRGDVLAVSKNAGETRVRIEITRDKKYGEITGEGERNKNSKNEKYFNINADGRNEEYIFSYVYNAEYTDDHSYFTKPEIGDTGVMYLNSKGQIAAFYVGAELDTDTEDVTGGEKRNSAYKYGYLKSITIRESDDTLSVKILTLDNVFEKFAVSGKLRLGAYEDGSYSVRKKDVVKVAQEYADVNPQLVKYLLDSDGKLTELCLSQNGANTSVWGASESVKTREFANFQLEQQYVVDSTTACFYIPTSSDEDAWKASKAVTMLKSGSSYRVSLYDIMDGNVGIVLYTPTLATTRYKYILDYVNSPVMLVDDISQKYDEEEGTNVKVVSGWQSGEYVEVAVSNTLENNSDNISNLRKGMLIQYLMNSEMRSFAINTDKSEEMILFNSICDFENIGDDFIMWDYASLTDNNARIKVYKGTIDYIDNDNFYVTIDGDVYVASIHGGTTIMRYKHDARSLEKADIEDISVGSSVVVRQRYNNTRDVFILE